MGFSHKTSLNASVLLLASFKHLTISCLEDCLYLWWLWCDGKVSTISTQYLLSIYARLDRFQQPGAGRGAARRPQRQTRRSPGCKFCSKCAKYNEVDSVDTRYVDSIYTLGGHDMTDCSAACCSVGPHPGQLNITICIIHTHTGHSSHVTCCAYQSYHGMSLKF